MPGFHRFGTAVVDGAATVVVGTDAGVWPLDALLDGEGPATMLELVADHGSWAGAIELALADPAAAPLDEPALEWLAPIMPRKLICIGANYGRHNQEMLGDAVQQRPYSFLKPPTTTLVGHRTAVPLPGHARKIDYEVELAIVIGARVKGLTEEEARESIFGYSVLNDISARDWVPGEGFMGMDWVMLKGFDSSAPMGPWITPAAFVPEPERLAIGLSVNGEVRQDSSTDEMVFSIERLVAHLSSVMTLEPGDVIATGTPHGVAFGRDDHYLQAGDVVHAHVEGLGVLENRMVVAQAPVEPLPEVVT